jgi:hypothetical protein
LVPLRVKESNGHKAVVYGKIELDLYGTIALVYMFKIIAHSKVDLYDLKLGIRGGYGDRLSGRCGGQAEQRYEQRQEKPSDGQEFSENQAVGFAKGFVGLHDEPPELSLPTL